MLRRYQRPSPVPIDLDKPVYFSAEHHPSRQSGYVRRAGGLNGAGPLQRLIWSDQMLADLSKARDNNVVVYTEQTGVVYPDYHVTDLSFARPRQITDANPQQRQLTWSPGARRLGCQNEHGETRYATLWLPANYHPGRKYPTIVHVYEQVAEGFNHSLQTYDPVDGRPAVFSNTFYLRNQAYTTQPWWRNPDAYTRNSPLHHAKHVTTPFLIRQNDRDYATPFFKGVQYFNLLRGMGKPVVMLQYAGAGHNVSERPEDDQDFARRRLEFFDHFLKGSPAPHWWTEGVP